MDRYKFYKTMGCANIRKTMKESMLNTRKDQRLQRLEELRNINTQATPEQPKVVTKPKKSRLEVLKEWKLQKAQKENKIKELRKPPFYAGRMQTTATGSPKMSSLPDTHALSGVVTRACSKSKNLPLMKPLEKVKKKKTPKPLKLEQLNRVGKRNVLYPVDNHAFVAPKAVEALQKLTIPQSPKITKSARKSVRPLFQLIKEESESNAMVHNHLDEMEVKAPKAKRMLIANADSEKESTGTSETTELTLISSDGKADLKEKMDYTPDHSPRPINNFQHLTYSPFIQKERGNSKGSRRSSKKSMTMNERVDIEVAEEETKLHSKIAAFRVFLANETRRLLGLAEKWTDWLKSECSVSSDVEGDVNAVAGKTKLLTSDKFKQFDGLIDKCEAGDPKIKVDDLEGFHDWVSLEIEDLDKVFASLQQRKNNNWVVEAAPKVVKKPAKRKPPTNVAPKRNVPSSIRAHIMAARKQAQTMMPDLETHEPVKKITPPTSPRFLMTGTPRDRSNLRIQVLQRCSGLTMLAATAAARASLSPSKTAEAEMMTECGIPPATPNKSILKKTHNAVSEKKNVMFGSTLNAKFLLPAEELSDDSPTTEITMSMKKTLLDPAYLFPSEDSSDDSPTALRLIEDFTPPVTPRRSARLARNSAV